jgi:hypothetical protein
VDGAALPPQRPGQGPLLRRDRLEPAQGLHPRDDPRGRHRRPRHRSGALVLGVPFASGIALLVFIGSFIPVVGALLSGFVAVALAFVAKGPLLLGRAVRVHPLAVILGIATGIIVGGNIGALTAVPLVAVLNAVGHNLLEPTPEDVLDSADLVTDVEHAEITEDIAEADELARPDRESPPHDA